MRKIIILLATAIFCANCAAQKVNVEDVSENSKMNYVFARIEHRKTLFKELYSRAMFVSVYEISDAKITPEDYSKGSEEFLKSYFVSVVPDGDYYTTSKLYKIEGLTNPKILEVIEKKYPSFVLKIEYGNFNDRKTESVELEGAK